MLWGEGIFYHICSLKLLQEIHMNVRSKETYTNTLVTTIFVNFLGQTEMSPLDTSLFGVLYQTRMIDDD
jgi:hypothetical protein